jgi:hypothetical protein
MHPGPSCGDSMLRPVVDDVRLACMLGCRSRLGCQIIAAKELDGIRVRIPAASRNFYVDGHRPQPH